MSGRPQDMDWGELLDTRPSAGLDEIRDAFYRQTGQGRPPVTRASSNRYVEDPEALAGLRQAMQVMDD